MSDDRVAKIKRNIGKTGHPLEFYVFKTLRDNNWSVYPHPLYLPETDTTGKYFEVDVAACKLNTKSRILSSLIIECKKSEKPWVFFKDKSNLSIYALTLSSLDDDEAYLELEKLEYAKTHHYFKDDNFCTWYMHPLLSAASDSPEVKNLERQPNQIYDAINQVINALKFYYNQSSNVFKYLQSERFELQLHTHHTDIFYPIIVLEGDLFEAELTNDPVVIPVNHIKFNINIEIEKPFKITRPSGTHALLARKNVVIDIVKKEFLANFLEYFKFY